MAMLAEKRRKSKWTINPRGNDWLKDESMYGRKILEKMGWAPGKGLGAKEQGISSYISVKFKNDLKGLGQEGLTKSWTKQQEEFSNLLTKLNGTEGTSSTSNMFSLEEKSKATKTRVHYHKFTRGKDLSKRSKEDLSCILGPAVIQSHFLNNVQQFKDESKEFHSSEIKSENLKLSNSSKKKKKRKTNQIEESKEINVNSNGVLSDQNVTDCKFVKKKRKKTDF